MASIMEGPLSKWTNVMKGWQYRWFVLDYNAGLLSYYTNAFPIHELSFFAYVSRSFSRHLSSFSFLKLCDAETCLPKDLVLVTPSSPRVLAWLLPGQQGQPEQRVKDNSDLVPADHTPLKNQSCH